jgi:predicted nuclease of predicted toxin-antitoxin system
MRFIVDECVGPMVARWLREQSHDVYSVYDESRGLEDEAVIRIAVKERRVLITNDKDFGDKVYREGSLHSGVVLLRLDDQSPEVKIAAIERLLLTYPNRVEGSFAVVTERQVRFGKAQRLTLDQ